jgi:hypothetical protein
MTRAPEELLADLEEEDIWLHRTPGPPVAPPPENRLGAWKGGAVAGLMGGALLSCYMFLRNLIGGRDVWQGMKMAGLPFLGEAATQPGFAAGPVLAGILSHFAVSIAWGILFAWLFYGVSRRGTVAFGALWGIVVWLGMFYMVLPLIGAGGIAKMAPAGQAVFEHVLFGLGVGIGFLPFQPRDPMPPGAPFRDEELAEQPHYAGTSR